MRLIVQEGSGGGLDRDIAGFSVLLRTQHADDYVDSTSRQGSTRGDGEICKERKQRFKSSVCDHTVAVSSRAPSLPPNPVVSTRESVKHILVVSRKSSFSWAAGKVGRANDGADGNGR